MIDQSVSVLQLDLCLWRYLAMLTLVASARDVRGIMDEEKEGKVYRWA